MSSLRQWLEQRGLGKYAKLLDENEVDLDVLPELQEADLEKIGLALGPRKKLLKAIRELDLSPASDSQKSTLKAALTGEAERRQLTVMFADLVGSTELAQKLDPEELREINRAYQDAVTAAIERYDGYVARYMGDGVLAYFGYPQAHEDDAERALRAGLELTRSVSSLQMGVALATRVGVATGPVVVGDVIGKGAAQESAVVGETPNLAARLQGVAEPDTVVISAATERLVRGRFDLDALGPQTLKGIGEPVSAFRAMAVRAVSRFDAAREHRLTPLVGRDEELQMLLRRWRLAGEGEGQVVLLAGEAGVGKSRILRALQDSLAGTLVNRILYYCSPYHQTSAFQSAIEQLERAARISHDQTPEEKLTALDVVVEALGLEVDKTVPLFAELLSIPYDGFYPALNLTPEQLRLQTLDALVETVAAMAVQEPVLFAVEDVHWIDPSTRDFLSHLIEQVRTRRTLVVITHRPEFEPPWSHYSHVTSLALNHLGRQDSAAMVTELAKGLALPKATCEEIIERTDGVPLFIEEMTAALVDSGFPPIGGAPDAAVVKSAGAGIPATLQDLLMERLDRLGPAKEVAQLAAVIGRSFTFDLLQSVRNGDEQQLQQHLDRLAGSGLIHGRRDFASSYDFKHALVRDIAYQSLLRKDRQAFHQRIAMTLVEAADDSPPLELIAHHFEGGGRFREAAQYWRHAGERALERFAHVEAISNFRQALAATDSLPEDSGRLRFEFETQTLLGPSLMFVFGQGAAEVEQTYARALELGDRLSDPQASFTAAWGMWRLQFARGDMRAAIESSLKCQQVSAGSNDRVATLGTAFALGATHMFNGDCSTAAPHFENSIELYRAMQDKSALAVFGQDPGLSSMGYLAWARWTLGFADQAVAASEEAVTRAREIGKPVLVAVATGFAGMTHVLRRDIAKLAEYAQESLSICEQYEFRQWAAMNNVAMACVYSNRGDHARATALAGDGLEEKIALGSYIALPWFCYLAADVYLAAGQMPKALEVAGRGIEFASRGAERFFESENRRIKAVILERDSDVSRDEVRARFDDALQLASHQKAKALELRAATSFARFLAERGDRDRAREVLSPLYDSFTEGFDTPDLVEAKTLVAELS